jgi:hypothetical protein
MFRLSNESREGHFTGEGWICTFADLQMDVDMNEEDVKVADVDRGSVLMV